MGCLDYDKLTFIEVALPEVDNVTLHSIGMSLQLQLDINQDGVTIGCLCHDNLT